MSLNGVEHHLWTNPLFHIIRRHWTTASPRQLADLIEDLDEFIEDTTECECGEL